MLLAKNYIATGLLAWLQASSSLKENRCTVEGLWLREERTHAGTYNNLRGSNTADEDDGNFSGFGGTPIQKYLKICP